MDEQTIREQTRIVTQAAISLCCVLAEADPDMDAQAFISGLGSATVTVIGNTAAGLSPDRRAEFLSMCVEFLQLLPAAAKQMAEGAGEVWMVTSNPSTPEPVGRA